MKHNNTIRSLVLGTIGIGIAGCALSAIATIVIDPYFHYHKPLQGVQYRIDDARYQNDGILKQFDYEAVIIGSSMVENFRTSQWKELFGTEAVKVPFPGAHYKELDENLRTAYESHDVKAVLRPLDLLHLADEKDSVFAEGIYPTYLYDDKIYNDTHYLFNKTVLLEDVVGNLIYTLQGNTTTDMDHYHATDYDQQSFTKENMLSKYVRPAEATEKKEFTDQTKELVQANLEQNIIPTIQAHPETTFYLYYPPYSIYWWDAKYQLGEVDMQIDQMSYVTDVLLNYENVKLFCFFDEVDMVSDVTSYEDELHYGGRISGLLLEEMAHDTHRLTKENAKSYFDQIRQIYNSYPYDELSLQ